MAGANTQREGTLGIDACCCCCYCCSFGRKSSLRTAQGVVFARVPPTTLVLETPHTQSSILDQSRSHLPRCEHSWAEQTTGPRTMRLRVRIQTVEKKTVPNHAQKQTTRTGIHGQKSGISHATVPRSNHRLIDTTPEAEGRVLLLVTKFLFHCALHNQSLAQHT